MKQADTVSTLRTMLAELKAAGFTGTIEFVYNGCGDSGDIEEPKIEPQMLGALHGLGYALDYSSSGYSYDDSSGAYTRSTPSRECVLSCIGELLPGGWEINEGSSGTVRLDIDTGTITVHHSENVMTTEESEWEV